MMQGIEPLLQQLRIWKVAPMVRKQGVLVDFGCDHELTLLRQFETRIRLGIGVDLIVQPQRVGKIVTLSANLERFVPLPDECADTVTMLAVLEHLRFPEGAAAEAYRILKPGGTFLATVPSSRIERVLPVLARIGLVRKDMIEQHQRYYVPETLAALARTAGFESVEASFWELNCNVFLRAVKKPHVSKKLRVQKGRKRFEEVP